VPDAQADEPQGLTQSLRDELVCPGMHAEWLDDKMEQCLKKALPELLTAVDHFS
jgi:hypothetical protein